LRDYKTRKAENEYKIFLDQETKNEDVAEKMSGFIGDIDNGADIDSVIKQAELAGFTPDQVEELRKYDEEQTKKAQNELFETLKDSAGSWTKEILEQNKPYLSPEQYEELAGYLPNNSYLGKDAIASNMGGATGTGRDLIRTPTKNDVFSLKIGEDSYKLKTGTTVSKEYSVYKYADKLSSGQVFLYDGLLYVKNGDAIQAIKKGSKDYAQVYEYLSGKAYK
jgi:hypothetical protein